MTVPQTQLDSEVPQGQKSFLDSDLYCSKASILGFRSHQAHSTQDSASAQSSTLQPLSVHLSTYFWYVCSVPGPVLRARSMKTNKTPSLPLKAANQEVGAPG